MKTQTFNLCKWIGLFAFLFIVSSCRTLNLTELTSQNTNENLLPPLQTEVDVSIVEGNRMNTTTSTTEIFEEGEVEKGQTIIHTVAKTKSLSVASNDYITLFERDVNSNITRGYGKAEGRIVCRIVAQNHDYGNGGLALLSVCSFGILNIFGMPYDANASSIDLDVFIYNKNDELIGRYNGVGKARILSAFYYGYAPYSATRLARIKAFKKAMDTIKMQIDRENARLVAALEG